MADTTGVFTSLTNQSLGPTHLSVCFFSGPNCNGGSNGGLESVNLAGLHGDPSTTGTFQVTLTFGQLVPPLDFSTFDGKFQTSAGSFEGFGTTGTQSVPEPGTLALLGTGLVGLALARRRKVG